MIYAASRKILTLIITQTYMHTYTHTHTNIYILKYWDFEKRNMKWQSCSFTVLNWQCLLINLRIWGCKAVCL